MKLRKVISGGQTGADYTGLECARELGLETGGWAPKGWRTEDGPKPSLAEFGVQQSDSFDYAIRTRHNALLSDATWWFGNTYSPGFKCTQKACEAFNKPFRVNPTPEQIAEDCELYETINIAGNRVSKNPKVVELVRQAFQFVAKAAGVEY